MRYVTYSKIYTFQLSINKWRHTLQIELKIGAWLNGCYENREDKLEKNMYVPSSKL